jgi:hypothetical protein
MTSEWTQRTALTTFTLAPRRAPVLAAKAAAAWLVSLAALAVAAVLTVAVVALAGAVHGSADFDGLAGDLASAVVLVSLNVLMGVAFGALAGATPVALGVYFLAPTVWANVSLEVFGDAAPWFDVFAAFDRLAGGDPFGHPAQTASAVTLWIVLPAVAGTYRALRREP